jgi:hypothetical protein
LVAEKFGSQTTVPQIYEKISLINHVHIAFPLKVWSGPKTKLFLYHKPRHTKAPVADAGHSDLYKMIIVPGGGHIVTLKLSQAPAAWLN